MASEYLLKGFTHPLLFSVIIYAIEIYFVNKYQAPHP